MSSYGEMLTNITKINGTAVSQGTGTANSGCQRITLASDTILSTTNNPPTQATYSANTNGTFAALSSATDMVIFIGSSTKTIKVLEIHLSYEVASTSLPNWNKFFLIKRSSANSGGTTTTETIVPLDSNNAAATAVMKSYRSGSNPTLGTTVGTLWTGWICAPITAAVQNSVNGDHVIFSAAAYGQPIVLRGTGESICLNNAGSTVVGATPKIGLIIYFVEE